MWTETLFISISQNEGSGLRYQTLSEKTLKFMTILENLKMNTHILVLKKINSAKTMHKLSYSLILKVINQTNRHLKCHVGTFQSKF